MSNPVNLRILLHLYNSDCCSLPNTLTELYHDFILSLLVHYSQKMEVYVKDLDDLPEPINSIIAELSQFAFNCIESYTFKFNKEYLLDQCSTLKKESTYALGLLLNDGHTNKYGKYVMEYYFISYIRTLAVYIYILYIRTYNIIQTYIYAYMYAYIHARIHIYIIYITYKDVANNLATINLVDIIIDTLQHLCIHIRYTKIILILT